MDVALDTNILLADMWLESKKIQALLDFLEKTRSHLLLHDVVLQEFRATAERQWLAALSEQESARRKVERLGLESQPLPDSKHTISSAWERWDQRFHKTIRLRKDIPLNNELLPEVVRRSINRIPPCNKSGEEIRDALLWLGLLDYCKEKSIPEFAFISANVREFSDGDGSKLAKPLLRDCSMHGLRVAYYTSLDDFLREHARPIEHITTDWISERVPRNKIQSLVQQHFELRDADEFRLPSYYDDWIPTGWPRIISVEPELADIYIWEYQDEEIVVFLSYFVRVEAELDCQQEIRDPEGGNYREQTTATGETERIFEVSAKIRGDQVEAVEIDNVEAA